MSTSFTFHGLDPRKTKKAQIEAALEGQCISWRRVPGLQFRGYTEAKETAGIALLAARTVPSFAPMRRLKQFMLVLQYNWCRAYFEAQRNPVALVWNGLNGSRRVWAEAAKDAGAKVLFFEHSPMPDSLTVDPVGVNFANALPREIAPYKAWLAAHPELRGAWQGAASKITQRKPVGKSPDTARDVPAMDQPFVFAPLQFQNDSQLRIFGGVCNTVEATIDHICRAAPYLPKGWHIRLKEHPSDPGSYRKHLEKVGQGLPVYFDNITDTFEQVRGAKLVCTVNSSVGLEALMLNRPVVTLGRAFWSIPSLAAQGDTDERLAAVFADPTAIRVDPEAREAFLCFLLAEYYPKLTKSGGLWSVPKDDRGRIISRLTRNMLSVEET